MKTILLMHYGGNQVRGSERCLIDAIEALSESNFRCIVLRKNDCLDEFIAGYADTVLDESFPEIMFDGPRRALPLLNYLRSSLQLYRTVKRYNPALILCNGGLPCQLAVPVGKRLKIPVLCHFHHPAPKRYLYLWLVNYATNLMFPSDYTRSVVREKCGRDGEVIHNGIDVHTRFVPVESRDEHFRAGSGIDPSSLVIGQVGYLSGHKRPDFLIRAFAMARKKLGNLHLVLVGNGPLYGELQQLIGQLSLEGAVTLAGYVADVLGYYQHVFDINVMASREEGLGISVIEASACALPSIVTDCTGLREVVDDQITGMTFAMDDTEQLADYIVELAGDSHLRRKLGLAARQKAVRCFSLERYKSEIVAQVNRVLPD